MVKITIKETQLLVDEIKKAIKILKSLEEENICSHMLEMKVKTLESKIRVAKEDEKLIGPKPKAKFFEEFDKNIEILDDLVKSIGGNKND